MPAPLPPEQRSRNAQRAAYNRGAGPKPAPLGPTVTSETWMQLAACKDHDPNLWFPAKGDMETQRQGVAICNTCPVRPACLNYALQRHESGTWGGMSERQRKAMRAQQRRGDAA